jgi:uncharacterized protein (TIGR02646 family)
MRRIHKGVEPRSLAEHRRKGGAYQNYQDRDEVAHALLRDQGAICCYCMQRISLRKMRVEHWDSQTSAPRRTLDYDNLLGACTGGENTLPVPQQHCDVSRHETKLHVNPMQPPPTCEQLVRYLPTGEITSDNGDVKNDVVKTLNLNTRHLVEIRKRLTDQLRTALGREEPDGHWPRELIEAHLARWRSRTKTGEYREYCQVVIYYLEKKLTKKA